MSIIQDFQQKIHGRSKNTSYLDVILLIILTAFILGGITLVPFHADESAYVNMSRDYDVIVKQGNFATLLLEAEDPAQGTRLTTGSIWALLIGFARDITGMGDHVNNNWRWSYSWEENIEQGNIPNPQLLKLARASSALLGSFSIVFFFLGIRQLLVGFPFSAWIAAVLLATHAGILVNFRRAMQEGPKFLFLMITLYISTWVLKNLKSGKVPIPSYVFLGIASGITLATKQDTAPLLVAIYLALALIPLWQKHTGQIIFANVLHLFAATVLAFASFLACMPIFWGWWQTILVLIGFATLLFQISTWNTGKTAKPLAMAACALIVLMTLVSPTLWNRAHIPISKMMEVRKSTMKGQVDYLESSGLFYFDTLKNKAWFIIKSSVISDAAYMEVLSFDIDPINQQITRYENSHLAGRMDMPMLDILILLFFMAGTWVLLKSFSAESLMIFSLLFVTTAVLFASVPLPWQRYFLIIQIPYTLIAGVGAVQAWETGKILIQQRSKKHS